MPYCSKCGFKLPEDAAFCPNCGAPVKKVEEKRAVPPSAPENVMRPIMLGLVGSFLALAISSMIAFANPTTQLYFIPYFIASLIVVYFSGTKSERDGVIIAMVTYLFTDAIFASTILGELYITGQPLASLYDYYVPTLLDVLMYAISPITALLAGYIGSKMAPKKERPPLRGGRYGPPPLFHGIKFLRRKVLKRFK